MTAEVADADDRRSAASDSGRCIACSLPRAGRRSRCRLVGRRNTCSPSSTSVRPASTDSARRAGDPHRLDRRNPDHRHVEAHVLLRLRDLDDPHAGTGQVPGPARSLRRCLPSPRPRPPPCASRRWSGRCRARQSRRPSGSRTRNRRAPRSVGARDRSARPSRASSGCRNTVESSSSMPSSRITSATAEISASVLRALSRVSTDSSVRSGTMPEKILTCLTWPAITAWDTPAALRILMHLPSCPSDTQWNSAPRVARRRLRDRGTPLP